MLTACSQRNIAIKENKTTSSLMHACETVVVQQLYIAFSFGHIV
jgi:hypothetical protein